MLRNHVGALCGILVTLAAALLVAGCHSVTSSTRDPGKKIDAAGLAAETIDSQADLDREAATIEKQTRDYNAHLAQTTAKLKSAGEDLQRKDEQRRQLVSIVGGLIPAIASGRAMDPTLYTSAFFTLLGGAVGAGALVDSAGKSRVIDRLRSNTQNDPPSSSESAGTLPAAGAAAPGIKAA